MPNSEMLARISDNHDEGEDNQMPNSEMLAHEKMAMECSKWDAEFKNVGPWENGYGMLKVKCLKDGWTSFLSKLSISI